MHVGPDDEQLDDDRFKVASQSKWWRIVIQFCLSGWKTRRTQLLGFVCGNGN